MRTLLALALFLLTLLLPAFAAAQRVQRPPPEALAGRSAIGHVSLGMDAFGRERLCANLDAVFAEAAKSLDSELRVKTACEGDPRNRLTLTGAAGFGATGADRGREVVCDLLRTPIGLFAPELGMVWIRRGESPKPWVDLAATLEGLGVRDLGRFLDAAGFDRLMLRTGSGRPPLVDERIYKLNEECS